MKVLHRSALLTFLVLTAASPVSAAPPTAPNHWCGSHPGKLLISAARHDFHQRHLARERRAGRLPMKSAPTVLQEGQIAILEDDGTATRLPMPFDLQGRSIQFLRRPKGMSAVRSNLGFKQLIGDRLDLGDDDSVEVSFPAGFEFPFGDRVYTSVYVNSNGILSFGESSPLPIIALDFLLFGPPAIAPLFTDLDPSSAEGEAGVFVNFPSNRVRITWRDVSQWATENSNTFQVTLFPTGRFTVAYGDVDALVPIVGVAPFEGFDLHLLDFSEELPLSPRRAAIAERFTAAPEVDELGVVEAFTESFQDVYTSVFIWLDFPAITSGYAFAVVLQNDVQGIGLDVFDVTNLLFPASRNLESFVEMGDMSRFPDDPDEIFFGTASIMVILGHEFAHRWLAEVRFIDSSGNPSYDLLNFPGGSHWSFFTNSEGSLMHGNAWADNGDGSFSATTRAHTRYSPLDRYLMGLAGPASVPDVFYIADPDDSTSPGALPVFEATVNGDRVDVSIDDIRAAEGPRRPPPAASPRSFRTAFLLVSLVGQDASPESIAKLDRYRRRWVSYFREVTNNRGEVTTALFPR
ncbi:MAG: hypothetical protein GY856_19495 [bacterium]|nr:hypothetical protein [bacterium]